MNQYRILQIAYHNWADSYTIPQDIEWHFISPEKILDFSTTIFHPQTYDFVLVDKLFELDYLVFLDKAIPTSRLLYHPDNTLLSSVLEEFFLSKQAKAVDFSSPENLIAHLHQVLLSVPQRKLITPSQFHLLVKQGLDIEHIGQGKTKLTGIFGQTFQPLGYYSAAYTTVEAQTIDIWPIFQHSKDLEVRYQFAVYQQQDKQDLLLATFYYDRRHMEQPCTLSMPENSRLLISIEVKGEGVLTLGNLAIRNSYSDYGQGMVGGHRLATAEREEIFYYFNPGKQSKILNVYFSDGNPDLVLQDNPFLDMSQTAYLVLADPRFEAGGYYLGSPAFEKEIRNIIQEHLDALSLTAQDCIFSGGNMGAFAALYYASSFRPHTVLLANPIVHLGNLALNEATVHPGKTSSILDILQSLTPRYTAQTAATWNQVLLDQLKQPDWHETSFAIATMKTDAIDGEAYPVLTDYLLQTAKPRQLISREFANNPEKDRDLLAEWFYAQYTNILSHMTKGN